MRRHQAKSDDPGIVSLCRPPEQGQVFFPGAVNVQIETSVVKPGNHMKETAGDMKSRESRHT
jgi:hypothetical protein